MNLKERQKWESIRSKGLAKYVIKRGIIHHAFASIASLIIANILWRTFFSYPELLNRIGFWIVYLIVALGYGMISALLSWSKNEDRYINPRDQRKENRRKQQGSATK